MKKLRLSLVLVGLTPTVITAQIDAEFLIHSGTAFMVGDENLAYYYNEGFDVGGGVDVSVSRRLSIRVSVRHTAFHIDKAQTLRKAGFTNFDLGVEGGSTSLWFASAGLKAFANSNNHRIHPYVLSGVGYIREKTEATTIVLPALSFRFEAPEPADIFGMFAGGGADVLLSDRWRLFVEATLLTGVLESLSLSPVVPSINAGALWAPFVR